MYCVTQKVRNVRNVASNVIDDTSKNDLHSLARIIRIVGKSAHSST